MLSIANYYQCIASLDSDVNYRPDLDNLAQIKELLVPSIASGAISTFTLRSSVRLLPRPYALSLPFH